jgi:hypothetical protein
MLTLTYNGYSIPLANNSSVRVEFINPACSFSEIPGDAALGIEIPVNEYTRAYLGNPHRFEKYATGSDRKFENVELRFLGALIKAGTLNITNATSETYSGWLQSQAGTLGDAQRDKFIGDHTWKSGQFFNNKIVYADGADEYCAGQMLNRTFWEEKGSEAAVIRDYYDEDGEYHAVGDMQTKLVLDHMMYLLYLINKRGLGGMIVTSGSGCVVSPMLFMSYFIAELFRLNRLFIRENQFAHDSNLVAICLYNNFNILTAEFETSNQNIPEFDYDYCPDEPLVEHVAKPPEILNPFWNDVPVNVIDPQSFVWSLGTFRYADLMPRISMKDFLIGLQNYLNVFFFFRSDLRVDMIWRENIIDKKVFNGMGYDTVTPIDLDQYMRGEWILGDRKDVTLKFSTEVDKEDRLFGQDWHDLSDRRADFADAVETWAELLAVSSPVMGEIRLVRSQNKYYEYKWAAKAFTDPSGASMEIDVLDWIFVSTGPQPYLFGTSSEVEEIKTNFSTLIQSGDQAMALQKGNLDISRSSWIEFQPRLVYYNGYLQTADPISGTSLDWDGPDGIFERRWKKWARFWKNRLPVEADFDLPLNMIVYLGNNIHRVASTRHGEFIIESMDTEFGLNAIGITHIKGYKLVQDEA